MRETTITPHRPLRVCWVRAAPRSSDRDSTPRGDVHDSTLALLAISPRLTVLRARLARRALAFGFFGVGAAESATAATSCCPVCACDGPAESARASRAPQAKAVMTHTLAIVCRQAMTARCRRKVVRTALMMAEVATRVPDSLHCAHEIAPVSWRARDVVRVRRFSRSDLEEDLTPIKPEEDTEPQAHEAQGERERRIHGREP